MELHVSRTRENLYAAHAILQSAAKWTLLRESHPPVVARVEDGRLLLDLRTVLPEQETVLRERLVAASG